MSYNLHQFLLRTPAWLGLEWETRTRQEILLPVLFHRPVLCDNSERAAALGTLEVATVYQTEALRDEVPRL